MPKAVYLIQDVRESMVRPVVLDITRQVLEWTGLPRTTQLLYAGENTEVFQPDSTMTTEARLNQFDSTTRWTINVEERTSQDVALTASVDYMDHPPIFYDPDSHVMIRPAYVEVDLVFSFVAKFTDRNHARMWRNDIRTRAAMNREARYHKASYSYLIPQECLEIAHQINKMRVAVASYHETFTQYWNRYITPKATVLSDQVDKNTRSAIAETQAELIGFFDFEVESEEGSKHAENSSWDIDFTYIVKIHVPEAVWMNYPLMVHNQLIPKEFRQTAKPPRPEDTKLQYSMIADALQQFVKQNQAVTKGIPGLSIPVFDDWFPEEKTIPIDTLRMVTVMTTIDEMNPLELVTLSEFSSKYHFNADVLEFMKSEYQYLTKYRLSILNVMVYKNTLSMPLDSYYVTEDLKVMLVDQPDLRAQYHVRVSLYQRPQLLTPEAKTRLRNHCSAALLLLLTLDPDIARFNPTCMIQDYMSEPLFNQIAQEIDNTYDTKWNKRNMVFNTVMTFAINAYRN